MPREDALAIVHATDFSQTSTLAFVHALRLALAFRGKLFLLHVHEREGETDFDHFPPVRATLAQWGLLAADAPRRAVAELLDIDVGKFEIRSGDPAQAIADFAAEREASLLVVGTNGRDGMERWLQGSIAESVSERSNLPVLFVPAQTRGFVDPATGRIELEKVIAPIDYSPDPLPALRVLDAMLKLFGAPASALELLHVGSSKPALYLGADATPLGVTLARGPIVETILEHAENAGLIAMPTEGRHGILDALRGSTTERVMRQAPCPVLSIPVRRAE